MKKQIMQQQKFGKHKDNKRGRLLWYNAMVSSQVGFVSRSMLLRQTFFQQRAELKETHLKKLKLEMLRAQMTLEEAQRRVARK